MKLILAEKPSVAKTIASFLGAKTRHNGYFEGNGYIITYAVGHLVSLYDMKDYDKDKYSGSWKMDNFPFIPQDKFKFKVESSKKDQFNIVKTLIHRDDIEYIINATDNDREGELIAFLIFLMAKNKKPVKRILVNEWTPQDITKGLQNLKDDEEMRNLQAAGYTRLITDWLIGINFTSIATLKYGNGKLLNIGRVILPTVKLIYDRDMEIKNFVPKTYFEIEGNFRCKNGEYKGKLIKNKNSKFDTPEEAKAIIGSITSKEATIIDKKVTTSKEYAPKLFSLTSLQGYITSKYSHFTSDKVLSVCQSLYEGKGKGGYITYPRTDSVYLEESLVGKTADTLNKLKKGLPYEDKIQFTKTKRVFDSSKVDSHSAITPTYIVPTNLTPDESIVYNAIKDRFIANFMPPAEYENTEIKTDVDENTFVTKGKVLKVKGYLEVYNKEEKNDLLPMVSKNEIVDVIEIKPLSKQTTPPKSYTEDTLLKAMKNCGKNVPEDDTAVLSGYSIGTSATRAEVLKKISQVGYVTKKGKSYFITELGKNLVEIFPVKELFDVDYTGKLEKSLSDIQKGKYTRKEYLNNIMNFIWNSVNLIKSDSPKKISTENFTYNAKTKKFISDKTPVVSKKSTSSKTSKSSDDVLGKCPACGGDVRESQKGFFCTNYSNCKYGIFKEDKYLQLFKKKPNKTMVKSLLKNGEAKVKSLTGKDGNKFDALLKYEKNSNGYYSWLIKKDQ
ncbi:MAG: DNA topoisomerase [Clostridiales bacterium]|uniref:type IA DNA topoisomerase n=1 Tax=Terrisporobacter sp. TaxID=1965305 RepID=UPI002A407B40|nr:DNA topoisomerase [Terrisporobacter sp.]MCI5628728.1 DNA topoisomerase [Clostridium sp.]MDD5879357.1 DNA topoisomerase [Clostridiales bacterium]MCI6459398.1 DNA topoisomerase [Clostridium sp.]MDD7753555.1 DNA topoisomerase [Clostridiales bacterium]MDY4136966.1 DNA topoisomerase [Terrisporobacter sp.]